MINLDAVKENARNFMTENPFNHCVIDGFFSPETANGLAQEFPTYDSDAWFHYSNPIEEKKALNNWNAFPPLTYRVFDFLNSKHFVDALGSLVGQQLYSDYGLHGGGWHIHASGGNLNPHLDYSLHPKLGLERKLNLIVYLSKELNPELHGGHLGLWSHDAARSQPDKLVKEVEPVFNRAILFDTTQHSWHGMSRRLNMPGTVFRKSLAVYYLCQPNVGAASRERAQFAPREEQKGDPKVERIIALRSSVASSSQVYKS